MVSTVSSEVCSRISVTTASVADVTASAANGHYLTHNLRVGGAALLGAKFAGSVSIYH